MLDEQLLFMGITGSGQHVFGWPVTDMEGAWFIIEQARCGENGLEIQDYKRVVAGSIKQVTWSEMIDYYKYR